MAQLAGIPLLPQTDMELEAFYGDAPRGVRANMVQTIDGAGAFEGRTKKITDPADQALLASLRSHADVVLVGGTTVQAEKYGPVTIDARAEERRLRNGYAATPPLAIVSARAQLPTDLRAFDPTGPRPLILTTAKSAAAHPELEAVADVVAVADDELDIARVVQTLHDRGLHRILCEGGPFILGQLIEQDLVDDMCLTVSPFFAGHQATTSRPTSKRGALTKMGLRHVLTRNELLYLRYSRP